jgi:hypothetical protein
MLVQGVSNESAEVSIAEVSIVEMFIAEVSIVKDVSIVKAE